MVCLLAANHGSNCSFSQAMDGRIVRCSIISSCNQLPLRDCKSASDLESISYKKCYSNYWNLPLPFKSWKVWCVVSSHWTGTKTIFAGSSCNDIAVVDGYNVVSAHFDRKLRFYDLRADSSTVREILLDGRITSVDLTLGQYSSCLEIVQLVVWHSG